MDSLDLEIRDSIVFHGAADLSRVEFLCEKAKEIFYAVDDHIGEDRSKPLWNIHSKFLAWNYDRPERAKL